METTPQTPDLVARLQRLAAMANPEEEWQAEIGQTCAEAAAALAAPPAAPTDDGSVMVRVDPVYVEQMRGEGLAGPFSRITLDEHNGVPMLMLTVESKPTPDTVEWWRAVAQELGVEIHKLKRAALAAPPAAPPADLVALKKEIQRWALYCFARHGDDAQLYNGLAELGGVSPDGLGWSDAAPPAAPMPPIENGDVVQFDNGRLLPITLPAWPDVPREHWPESLVALYKPVWTREPRA